MQLWFRVDRNREVVAFDNMQDRPIVSDNFQSFDIVLDVPQDATSLAFGIFLIGTGSAWIDDATLEAVSEEISTTASATNEISAGAAQAPQQSFWTPWLLLALLACALFAISQTPPAGPERPRAPPAGATHNSTKSVILLSPLQSFALRFSLLYWVLYSMPMPFSALAPAALSAPFTFYSNAWNQLTMVTASQLFGIDERSISPNGSGDTTYAYVNLFVCFGVAILVAFAWSLIVRRESNHEVTKDLLRSYLRYVLAATMIGYGLAKVGYIQNQFSIPGDARLAQTYGASSPMGLLWTFMGASRAYTIFGGLGEVLGGVLLLWRRTTTLGAIVVVGVLTNVVMLNFSYDVPVKQYSVHLLVMAIFLLLPEVRRLLSVVLWNRPTEATSLDAPYEGPGAPWSKRIVKIGLVLLLGVVPIARHVGKEIEHARTVEPDPPGDSLLMNRGFRWINEIPFNR